MTFTSRLMVLIGSCFCLILAVGFIDMRTTVLRGADLGGPWDCVSSGTSCSTCEGTDYVYQCINGDPIPKDYINGSCIKKGGTGCSYTTYQGCGAVNKAKNCSTPPQFIVGDQCVVDVSICKDR